MADNLFSVTGQVVVVSGASRGIGREIAAGFANRGARVIITGREAETLAATANAISDPDFPVRPVVCDVTNQLAVDSLYNTVLDVYNNIDTVINVAGIGGRYHAINLDEASFDRVMAVNLKGAFRLSQVFGRKMIHQGRGCIINIVSVNNDRPLTWLLPYAISKAGLGQMTKSLAAEWGQYGVRVNAIAPGFILTDMTQRVWSQPAIQEWGITNVPLRRIGTPQDLVGAAIFLASNAAAYITGQTIYADGGFTCGTQWPIAPPST